MKSRNEHRRGDQDWRDEDRFSPRERSAYFNDERRGGRMGGMGGDDYERGYWGNDYERGGMGRQSEGRAYQGRDSWRTHGHDPRFYGPGMEGSGGEQGRGTLGAGYMSDYSDDREDWRVPSGPRTWGSGVGSGMQGRGMGQGRHSDPDYQQWRDEQLRRFDDDFEAFRRERYGKFATEFDAWRSNRASQGGSNEGKPAGSQAGTPAAEGTASEIVGGRSGEPSSSKQQG